jgi:hypothetical protein
VLHTSFPKKTRLKTSLQWNLTRSITAGVSFTKFRQEHHEKLSKSNKHAESIYPVFSKSRTTSRGILSPVSLLLEPPEGSRPQHHCSCSHLIYSRTTRIGTINPVLDTNTTNLPNNRIDRKTKRRIEEATHIGEAATRRCRTPRPRSPRRAAARGGCGGVTAPVAMLAAAGPASKSEARTLTPSGSE